MICVIHKGICVFCISKTSDFHSDGDTTIQGLLLMWILFLCGLSGNKQKDLPRKTGNATIEGIL